MSMDQFLAEFYGTKTAAASPEALEKQAQNQLFANLAAENNIDLAKLSQAQVQYLWNETFAEKVAEDGAPPPFAKKEDDDKDDEKKKRESAEKEHGEKRAAAEKIAEAELCGRVMAHACAQELRKIASATEQTKEAGMAGNAARALGKGLESAGEKVIKTVGRTHGEEAAASPLLKRLAAGAAGGAAAATAGGAAVAGKKLHDKMKKKEGSAALDELAGVKAVEKAAAAGWDGEEAGQLIAAVLTLPIPESTKIASAADLDAAVDLRSHELLELAGYPVNW